MLLVIKAKESLACTATAKVNLFQKILLVFRAFRWSNMDIFTFRRDAKQIRHFVRYMSRFMDAPQFSQNKKIFQEKHYYTFNEISNLIIFELLFLKVIWWNALAYYMQWIFGSCCSK